MTTNTQFFQALEEMRTIRWEMNAMIDNLRALSGRLDEVVDALTESQGTGVSWTDADRRTGDILSIMLQKSIEDDERARG